MRLNRDETLLRWNGKYKFVGWLGICVYWHGTGMHGNFMLGW